MQQNLSHLHLTSWRSSLHSVKKHLVIVIIMCVEFASVADPLSKVFNNMASSRRTVVRRMYDIFLNMKDELKDEIQKAMFLGIMADESTDTAVSEQLILYMRYVDISREAISTRFTKTSDRLIKINK